MTWEELAAIYPEFVQWVVQKYGVKEGPITQEDYQRFRFQWPAGPRGWRT